MAASEVEICNVALAQLGEAAIASLADATDAARYCSTLYAPTRDQLLRAHPWNFATFRRTLNASAATPSHGYGFAYPLPNTPSPCLRVLTVEPADADYVIEGREILTDESSLSITYIGQVVDATQFGPLFAEALSLALAAKLAYPLTESAQVVERVREAARDALATARTTDSQEGSTRTEMPNPLRDVRRVSGSVAWYRPFEA
jgi:hypothetical protein